MSAFQQTWALIKEFRFDSGYPGYFMAGAYDPKTDTPYANLASHVSDFKTNHRDNPDGWGGQQRVFRSDEELMERVMRVLSHEHMHQALHPPYTDDLWNAVSMFGLSSKDVDEEEKARLQHKIDMDWQDFQEYGAWTGTMGITDEEKWRMLRLYGIYPKGGEP